MSPSSQFAMDSFADDPVDPRHGTVNGYSNLRCRCDRCRAAQTEYIRWYREAGKLRKRTMTELHERA